MEPTRHGTRKAREFPLSALSYPPDLPIVKKRGEIVTAVRKNQVVIVTGETGSGKTTQIPKMCLEAGRGRTGMIGCTQPRRVAAVTVAHRIAEELREEIGNTVAYKIRFEERRGPRPFIRIMTDGILLMEIQGDRLLRRYDTIIVDEAHERSLNIDFILGYLRSLLPQRPDLKVIITSATLEIEKFSRAFENAAVIEVTGRMYPVEVRYRPLDPDLEEAGEFTFIDGAVQAVEEIFAEGASGDILIFMPTEQDIRETCERLNPWALKGHTILPLYARLPWQEQKRVFLPASGRKIVVATNIAETSITIPNIRYVVDTGLARISQYNPRSKATTLPVRPISRSNADQRLGRCGRVRKGVCIRLYSEEDYLERPQFTPPEIMRANLAGVILRMFDLRLGDIDGFPFLDRPGRKYVTDALALLQELGALVKTPEGYGLTRLGRTMARLPLDPRQSRILLEGRRRGCLPQIQVIVSGLTVPDPRERPEGREAEADAVHGTFADPTSDFTTLLRIWEAAARRGEEPFTQSGLRRFCRAHFLSFRRMREWRDVHDQIGALLSEHLTDGGEERREEMSPTDLHQAIHKAVLSGYLSHIAQRVEKNRYRGIKDKEVFIFPASALYRRGGEWIVAAEMVETSRLYARVAANVEVSWIVEAAGDLCRSSFSTPRWDKAREEVVADERVTLFGMTLIPSRTAAFGPFAPEEAATIFIRDGLMTGEVRSRLPFLKANLALVERIRSMEEKTRRRDLVDEEAVFSFYRERLPGIYDVRGLRRLIRERGGDSFLYLTEGDVLKKEPDEAQLAAYPDRVGIDGVTLPVSYRFAPGRDEDGASLTVPVGLLTGLSAGDLDWAVPGLTWEKILHLLRGLPREYRRQLPPPNEVWSDMKAGLAGSGRPLTAAMSAFIQKRYGVSVPPSAWPVDRLPDHLRLRLTVVDGKRDVLAAGRDLAALRREVVEEKENEGFEQARRSMERDDIRAWDFGDLPETVTLTAEGTVVGYAFGALEDRGEKVRLTLFRNLAEARRAHPQGVRRLAEIVLQNEIRYLKKSLALPPEMKEAAAWFGSVKALEEALRIKVTTDLFAAPVRTPADFETLIRQGRPRLLPRGQEVLRMASPVVKAVENAAKTIGRLEKAEKGSPRALSFLRELKEEMRRLVPIDFLRIYPEERLPHLCRYLKALMIRAERGLMDLERDRARGKEIRRFTERLEALRRGTDPLDHPERAKALEDLAWMIEEYKVSLFAQELKTPYPVSAKRLEERFAQIELM
ncbi:MAG TPA: ATP-dependent RNA helicase HrpA [Syntrophales bacterium]|nr:ATP-dependent RNA helicase HrpA [Syntrophales bacterium]